MLRSRLRSGFRSDFFSASVAESIKSATLLADFIYWTFDKPLLPEELIFKSEAAFNKGYIYLSTFFLLFQDRMLFPFGQSLSSLPPFAFYLQFWQKGVLLKTQNNSFYLLLHLRGAGCQAVFTTLFQVLVILLPLRTFVSCCFYGRPQQPIRQTDYFQPVL
jgi:hypothetical protein